eukprot:13789-Heterococcus_DN1.PRE.2
MILPPFMLSLKAVHKYRLREAVPLRRYTYSFLLVKLSVNWPRPPHTHCQWSLMDNHKGNSLDFVMCVSTCKFCGRLCVTAESPAADNRVKYETAYSTS